MNIEMNKYYKAKNSYFANQSEMFRTGLDFLVSQMNIYIKEFKLVQITSFQNP